MCICLGSRRVFVFKIGVYLCSKLACNMKQGCERQEGTKGNWTNRMRKKDIKVTGKLMKGTKKRMQLRID